MSEIPQPNPQEMQDSRVHDINEAHELAIKTDTLETERAAQVGALALLGEAYVHDTNALEAIDKAKASGQANFEEQTKPGLAEGSTRTIHVPKNNYARAIRAAEIASGVNLGGSGNNYEGSASRIFDKLDKLDASIKSVHETGLTTEQKERADAVAEDIKLAKARSGNAAQAADKWA